MLALQRVRQLDARLVRCRVGRPNGPSCGELIAQRSDKRLRQHQHPVLAALARPDDEGLVRKVDILDAQLQRFVDAHASAVQMSSVLRL